jgi:hypothetical protein
MGRRVKPIEFDGCDAVYAKDQPEYLPLPVRRFDGNPPGAGGVTSCWELTWLERLKIFINGHFYISMLTFDQPLQPIRPHVDLEDGL